MRLLSVMVAALVGISALPLAAQPVTVSTVTTSMLATLCQRSRAPPDADFCTGYIAGAFDQLVVARAICPGPRITTEQFLAVGRRFIETHPELWDRHPSVVLEMAFKPVFTCPNR